MVPAGVVRRSAGAEPRGSGSILPTREENVRLIDWRGGKELESALKSVYCSPVYIDLGGRDCFDAGWGSANRLEGGGQVRRAASPDLDSEDFDCKVNRDISLERQAIGSGD